MLVLTLRTDKAESEIGLYEDKQKLVYETWQAHRQLAETIHSKIKSLLNQQRKEWTEIRGIVVYRGPGSFTGLRIGLSVANALAASLNIPICGHSGEDWLQAGVKTLQAGKGSKFVMPEYGSNVHVTTPRK